MAYLAKQALVKALKIVKDAEVQVSTPCLSAIQYFIALDRFYHLRESEEQQQNVHIDEPSDEQAKEQFLDGSSTTAKKEFISYVSEVISLDDGSYLKTFKELYEGKKAIQGTIQSNFFGGSSVDISRKSPDKVVYPQQDNRPLFYCLKGNVYREKEYYDNLQYYITTQDARFALAIWLLRKDYIEELSIESIREKLAEKYTQRFVDVLIPQENISYDDLKESLELSISQEIAQIYKSDFLMRQEKEEHNSLSYSHQEIFYGAPGTGKSHEIKEKTKGKSVIRTTFHPDSDYSTFVGTYKPTMEDSETMVVPVVVNNGISLQEKGTFIEKRIVYKFIMQAFLKAYLGAWKKYTDRKNDEVEPQFLVIEEINRGNCAQIFGDLFQLLDRNDEHFSEYPIESDTDLQKEIERAFKEHKNYKLEHDIEVEDIIKDYTSNYDSTLSEDIQHGRVMLLPPNLYIWATMNTSDQSLFPIDSAFKRRWEWKYMKIKNEGKEWKIDVKIKDANGEEKLVDWWDFIRKVNDIIASMTSSADKQLGYFFCKADKKTPERANEPNSENDLISVDTFVSKVLFYLWNDVFKDYGFEDASLFQYTKTEDGKETKKDLTFPDFYKEDSNDVNPTMVTDFVQKVMNWKKKEETQN